MQEEALKNLKEALKHSPDNIHLRLIYAEALLNFKALDIAEQEFKIILDKEPINSHAKFGLARAYFEQKKFSTAIIILEDLLDHDKNNIEFQLMLSKAFLKNNEPGKALEYYQNLLSINPSSTDEELDQYLRNKFGLDERKVVLNNLIDGNGSLPLINQNKVVISLINIPISWAK